jgi:hypothetical protein
VCGIIQYGLYHIESNVDSDESNVDSDESKVDSDESKVY